MEGNDQIIYLIAADKGDVKRERASPSAPNPSAGDSFAISVGTNNKSYRNGRINVNFTNSEKRKSPHISTESPELRLW